MTDLFETARLRARHITADDFDAMYATYSDPIGARWVDDGEPISPEDCRRWIEVTVRNYATRGYGMSALCLRPGTELPGNPGDIVGFIGLVHPGGQAEPELKYSLRRLYWGYGLATEAARGMLAYGVGAFALPTVIATVAEPHGASRRVLEKAGMMPTALRPNDDGIATVVYSWSPPPRGTVEPPQRPR